MIDDPGEENDLIEEQPEVAARMRAELDAWNRSVDKSVTGADYPEGRVLPSGPGDEVALRPGPAHRVFQMPQYVMSVTSRLNTEEKDRQ